MKPVIIILGILIYAFECSGQFDLSGVVYSQPANEPVFGANIFVEELNYGTATDENGAFKITNLRKGNYTINVSYIGYKTLVKKISVSEKNKDHLEIRIKPENYHLGEVAIVAQENENIDINRPQKIHLIKAEQIELNPGSNTDHILDFISGVNVERNFGIYSDKASVTMRGVGSDQGRTLVILDGIPLNKSDGGSVNWNLIDKNNINDIKIIKGPGCAKYGSSAMGGVIEISSIVPEKELEGSIGTKYGTYNTKSYNIQLRGKIEHKDNNQFYWNLNHNLINSDGYINIPDELITAADTDIVASYLREYLIGTKIGYKTEKTKIEVSGNYFDDKRGKGFCVYEKDGGFSEHDTYNSFFQVEHQFDFIKLYFHAFTIHEEYGRMNEFMQDGEYKLYEIASNRDDRGSKLFFEKRIGGTHQIVFGTEYKNGNVKGEDIYYTSTDLINNAGSMDIYSLFIQDEFNLFSENFILSLGLRSDYAKFYKGLFTITDPSYSIEYLVDYQQDKIPSNKWSALSPKFSMQYMLNENSRIYFSSGKGFRAPDLDDMCRSSKSTFGFTMLNPELAPEYLINYELGTDFLIKKKIEISGSVFYSEGKDYIYTTSSSDSVNMGYTIAPVFKKQNISKVEIYGFEMDLNINIISGLSAFANYSYTSSKIKDFIVNSKADFNLTDKYLRNMPLHKSSAGLLFKRNKYGVNLLWKYIGERYINDQNRVDEVYFFTDKFDAYQIFDLKLYLKIKKHYSLSLSLENILDEKYNNQKGYLNPGRFIMLEFVINLDYKK